MDSLVAVIGLVVSLHVLRVNLSFVYRPKAFDDVPGVLLQLITIVTIMVAGSAAVLFTIRYFSE